MQLDVTLHCAKDLALLKKNDPQVFKSLKRKIDTLLAGQVPLEPLQGHKDLFKTRVGKYRLVYTFV